MRTTICLACFVLLVACDTDPAPEDSAVDSAVVDGGDAGPGALPACGTSTPDALMACVEQARYVADLEVIEGPRAPGDAHHIEVRDLAASRLAELGFTVELHDYGTGVNVVGVLPGTVDEQVLISAHYDSVPGCEGADDNGSGVAGAFEAARVLASATHDRTLVIALWDEEERGLIGSRAYADRASGAGDNIVANLIFEMIGFRDDAPNTQTFPDGFELLFPRQTRQVVANDNRGDFILLVADQALSRPSVDAFTRMARRIELPMISLVLGDGLINLPELADLRRSDHAGFWDNGDPGVMIGDTANFRYSRYHCGSGPDTINQLDHVFATQVIQATVGASVELLRAGD